MAEAILQMVVIQTETNNKCKCESMLYILFVSVEVVVTAGQIDWTIDKKKAVSTCVSKRCVFLLNQTTRVTICKVLLANNVPQLECREENVEKDASHERCLL